MTVLSCLLVNWSLKIELLDNVARSEVKILNNNFSDLLISETVERRLVSINMNRKGICESNSVRNLNESSVGKLVCNDWFSNISCIVSSWSVDLSWVLTRECTTTVRSPSTISINDNLATSKSCVSIRASENKLARWVNNNLWINKEMFWYNLLDYFLVNGWDNSLLRNVRVVLCRNQNVVNTNWSQFTIVLLLILKDNLGFSVRT